MAEGYFDDGTVHVELGAHVFATPGGRRRIVRLQPHSRPGAVLDSGGGVLELEVTGQRLRANLGDAERYIYEQLRALATSDPGELGFEDNRGYRHVFGDSVCLGGIGEVFGYKFVSIRFDFESPEKSSVPAWGSVPAAPGAYPGTATFQDYSAGGVNLGLGGAMRIEMRRSMPLREVPRARGSRASVPPYGAEFRFVVEAARVAGAETLATDIEDLQRQVSGRVNLVANGNVYRGVLLEGVRPRHTDKRHTGLEIVFVQDIARGEADRHTTTTAAPTTTTTTGL